MKIMMDCKRKILSAFVFLMLGFLWIFPIFSVCAAESPNDSEKLIEEQLDESGIKGLFELIPEEGEDFFANGFDSHSIEKLTPTSFFGTLWEKAVSKAMAPLSLFFSIVGILILAALLAAFTDGMNRSGEQNTFSMVVSLSICAVLVTSVTHCIFKTAQVVRELSYFVLSFIPVFSAVTAAAGKPASSVVYHATVFASAQFFSQLMANLIVPLLGLFLAISIAGSATNVISVESLSKTLKTAAAWILTLCLTVFVGLLTIKGFVSGAADTVTVRATKFVISSVVPVVGGALSEAYNSVFGCLGVVKSTVGVFGILAIVFT
ncbi:MAG: hypothetical protein RR977_04880, partial [Oscillospiraceae bacterium]